MSFVPLRLSSRSAPVAAPVVAGGYLTDGGRLFRVVSQSSDDRQRMVASLEDCLTLELQAYTSDELHEMGLQAVRAVE